MRAPIVFEIPGLPEAQGSAQAFVVAGKARIQSTNKRLKPWRRDAIAAAREATDGIPLQGPITVGATFVFPRPKAHFGTGRNWNKLKQSAPRYKTSKPDVDKLIRALLDALTGAGVYRDDSEVATVEAAKVYTNRAQSAPGVAVMIAELAAAV